MRGGEGRGEERKGIRGDGEGRGGGEGTTQTQCAAKRPYKCSVPVPPLLLQNMCTIHSR